MKKLLFCLVLVVIISCIAAQHLSIDGLRRRMQHALQQQQGDSSSSDDSYSPAKSMLSTFSNILFNSKQQQEPEDDAGSAGKVSSISGFFQEVFNGFKLLAKIPSKHAKSQLIKQSVNVHHDAQQEADLFKYKQYEENLDLDSLNFNNKRAYYEQLAQQRESQQIGTPIHGEEIVEDAGSEEAVVTENGATIEPATRRATPRATIPKNPCDASAFYVTYNTTNYFCNNTQVSFQDYLGNRTKLNCTIVITPIYTCVCPLDRTNANCVKTRTFTCQFKLVSPEKQCENPNIVIGGLPLDGDFPCFRFSMKDTVTFGVTMLCSFVEAPASTTVMASIPRNVPIDILQPVAAKNLLFDQVMGKFVYFVNSNSSDSNPSFAIRKPILVPIEFLAFNFYSFSDTRGSFPAVATTPNAYIGKDVINYSVKFSNLTDEFFAGDRLYVEVGYHKTVDQLVPQFERVFIDFNDRSAPPYVDNSTLIMAITIPIGSVIVLTVALVVLTIYCCKKVQEHANNEKQD